MKVLSLSSDRSIINPDSKSAGRMIRYGSMADSYSVITFADRDQTVKLADNVIVHGLAGNRFFALYKMYRLARRLVASGSADVITAQDPFELALIGWILGRRYRVGLNIQEHGDFFSATYWRNENIKNFLRYYLGLFLLPRADSIRAVSQRIKSNLVNKLNINEDKIVVVPVFVKQHPGAVMNPIPLVDGLKGKKIILTMARLVKQKNLILLLRAFADSREKFPETALVIVGRGPEKNKLIAETKKLKLNGDVVFVDWTDDIYAYYRSADIYALSSNYEGWGMVIVEAASCGLPIVMTDVGCANEVIKNNESGLIVPIGDRVKFAVALSGLVSDESLCRTLGEKARSAIGDLPDERRTLELYRESWDKALKK